MNKEILKKINKKIKYKQPETKQSLLQLIHALNIIDSQASRNINRMSATENMELKNAYDKLWIFIHQNAK